MTKLNEVFGRKNSQGTVDILYINDGDKVTRLDVDGCYPVNSSLSTHYHHANGIVLTVEQCNELKIEVE